MIRGPRTGSRQDVPGASPDSSHPAVPPAVLLRAALCPHPAACWLAGCQAQQMVPSHQRLPAPCSLNLITLEEKAICWIPQPGCHPPCLAPALGPAGTARLMQPAPLASPQVHMPPPGGTGTLQSQLMMSSTPYFPRLTTSPSISCNIKAETPGPTFAFSHSAVIPTPCSTAGPGSTSQSEVTLTVESLCRLAGLGQLGQAVNPGPHL